MRLQFFFVFLLLGCHIALLNCQLEIVYVGGSIHTKIFVYHYYYFDDIMHIVGLPPVDVVVRIIVLVIWY